MRFEGGPGLSASDEKTKVRIFESYGWRDASNVAERLKDSLNATGDYDVWIDRDHLSADDKHFPIPLQQAVTNSEVVVALLSPHSVRGLSGNDEGLSYCYNEISLAEDLKRPIVPVRVQRFDGPTPFLIIRYRRIDWLDWEDPDAYDKGLRAITDAITIVRERGNLLDPRIAPMSVNFSKEMETAKDSFTGREWLFDRVNNWLDGPNSCLLIEGDAGSGKTALVAGLVRRNSPEGRMLAYHFCSELQVQSTVDPAAVVRSIAAMLATAIDAYAEQLSTGNLARWLDASDPKTMFRQGMLAPLREVPMDRTHYIAVDALDEADAISGGVSVPLLLAGALEEFPRWLKLLITSRPYQDVRLLFPEAERCVLGQSNQHHLADLRAFIANRLDDSEPSGVPSPADRDRACAQIARSADGNFQYATFVLDALVKGQITTEDLDRLPPGLNGVYYHQARLRFDNRDYGVARQFLSVLLAAREPLDNSTLRMILGDLDQNMLRAVTCFAVSTSEGWRIAHKSIADWLVSENAGEFNVGRAPGRERLLAYCAEWATHREPYALKHVIAHLLEAGRTADAMAAVQRGLFEKRLEKLREPRLDSEDAQRLSAALIAEGNLEDIVKLAVTANTWQRDGVAAALQSPSSDTRFVDCVVGELLVVST